MFLGASAFAQDAVLLNQNGVEITYKLTKISESGKKDNYLVTVNATNKNNFDSFYQGPKNGVNPFFATITIRNADKEVYLIATESKLFTTEGKLFYIKPNGTVSEEREFKIDKGTAPIITAKFVSEMKSISDFR